jgi:hypothetical protein
MNTASPTHLKLTAAAAWHPSPKNPCNSSIMLSFSKLSRLLERIPAVFLKEESKFLKEELTRALAAV